ncbi:TetR/AcrR family transcriptional regulator [Streptomyces monomycini]|uniref:TetR/AcrR family transcriptional regulator n=1 Tax=Streptomyces monomycini TaxID=371720 RepID=UPI0004AB0CF6|nr:TetR family transcriptional regulator [Streptomyces monomycini]
MTRGSSGPGGTEPGTRPAASRRRGRPSRTDAEDGPGARERILAAARAEFAARGYEKASIRGIAKAADVDPALVHHYYGSKEQVFAAAVEMTFAPALNAPETVLEGGLDGVGERLTRFVFGVWENPATREPLLAVVRSALTNDVAAAVFRKLVARQLLRRIAAELAVPDADLRAELAAAQLVGTAMLRYVIKLEPLASADPERIVARVAPVVQQHLTGP